MLSIAIHGGAGAVPRSTLTAEREQRYRDGLAAALDAGYTVLEKGGSSLDAVIGRGAPAWKTTPSSIPDAARH